MRYFADLHLEIEADSEGEAREILEHARRRAESLGGTYYGVSLVWADDVEPDERE